MDPRRWPPLVGRLRPACPSLSDRVKEIANTAHTAGQEDTDGPAEGAASPEQGRAVASDCSLASLARDLCWQHINNYGSRALALAGRWEDAGAHAQAHRGAGLHLMESRQATIMARRPGVLDRAHRCSRDSWIGTGGRQSDYPVLLTDLDVCRYGGGITRSTSTP